MKYIIVNYLDPNRPQYWRSPKGKAITASCNWFSAERREAYRYVSEKAAQQAMKRMTILRGCVVEEA